MKISKSATVSLLLSVFLFTVPLESSACSVAFLEGEHGAILARTVDWPTSDGIVVKNVRGIDKTAFLIPEGLTPYLWTSVYGSVTFNLIINIPNIPGHKKLDSPGCGLNEAGLCVATLFVDPPAYPSPGDKPLLRSAEVVRVLLDTCSNVNEALEKFNDFGLTGLVVGEESSDLHWFITDKSGNCAIVEFPPENSGKASVYYPPRYKNMTNDYYLPSYEYLAKYKGFGGSKPMPSDTDKRTSDVRFVRNVYFSQNVMKKNNISEDDGFFVMGKVAQTEGTKGSNSPTEWTVVYDLKNFKVSWTSVKNNSRRTIDLSRLDFSKTTQVFSMDIQSAGSGDVTKDFGERK